MRRYSNSFTLLCAFFIFVVSVFCQFDNALGGLDNLGGFSNYMGQSKGSNLNSLSSSSSSSFPDDANSDILKQVNNQDGGLRNSLLDGNDDQSVRELLKSFQLDDTKGNYLHHGDHGEYGGAENTFSEEQLKPSVESNADLRDEPFQPQPMAFNSPSYQVTKEVVLQLSMGGSVLGEVLIGLFGNTVPKTVANFVDLADHKLGFGYRGSRFHRVIKDFMIQGGDITNGDGSGGRSIYGAQFPDENFNIKMNGPGWACMANAGKDTNDSQFFITTADTPWLNGHHVCFGKVLKGMRTVYMVQDVPKNGEKPIQDVIISGSRSIIILQPFEVSPAPATE